MTDLHPDKRSRKASEFFDELSAISSVVLPEWNGVQSKGEFGYALLKVLAMLSERTSIGIAKTPLRDAIAFFNYLDVPPQSPQPATAPVAFLLNDKQLDSVFAPAGAQIGAATEDKEQIFETTSALQLSPGRLDFLAAVDTIEDRIEIAPQNFLDFEPTVVEVNQYQVPTPTNKGSYRLQIEPAEGLEEGDYIQFFNSPNHKAVYRLGAGKEGLFDLIDPLEQPVAANSPVRMVTEFEVFALRNVQRHEFFLGHKELLNLEQPSLLTVTFEPAAVADQLSDKLQWALYGTRVIDSDGTEKTDWHPVRASSAVSGSIVLTKNWAGSVDEFEVNGEKNRWLRAWHELPINVPELTTAIQTIKIRVKSLDDTEAENLPDSVQDTCYQSGENTSVVSNSDDQATRVPVVDKSISQAFHNSSPLPLTTRFFPFGPEPQRFDFFALAAPEALSKKNAIAKLDFTLSDASIATMSVALTKTDEGPRRVYAIGKNGHLQLLNFESTKPVWQSLGAPDPDDLIPGSELVSVERLMLDPEYAPQAMQYLFGTSTIYDIVIAMDQDRRLWFYVAAWGGTDNLTFDDSGWYAVKSPDAKIAHYVTAYRETIASSRRVVLIANVSNKLQWVRLIGGSPTGLRDEWLDVIFDAGLPNPELDETSAIVTVQSSNWPEPSTASPLKLVVTDKEGKPWLGDVTFDFAIVPNPEVTIVWTAMIPAADATNFDLSVAIAAGQTEAGEVFVYGAYNDNSVLRPRIIHKLGAANSTVVNLAGIVLEKFAVFQVFPAGFGNKARAVITGSIDGDPFIVIFRNTTLHEQITLPAGVDNPAPVSIFPWDNIPVLLICGSIENLLTQQLPDLVGVKNYHNALILTTAEAENEWMEFTGAPILPPEVVQVPDVASSKINLSGKKVFEFPAGKFAVGQWNLWKIDISTQLIRDADTQGTNELRVIAGQHPPAQDNIIIIEQHRYLVFAGPDANGLISLDRDINFLSDGNVDIDIVTSTGNLIVENLHQKTLLEIHNANTSIADPEQLKLKFSTEAGTVPEPEQQNAVGGIDNQTLWGLVDSAWTQLPDLAATVELFVSGTNDLNSLVFPRNYQNPELAWEYFDGDGWRRLEKDFVDPTENLARSGIISFPVPADLSVAEVSGQEDYFVRARLVGGDYGRPIYQVETIGSGNTSTQSVTIDTSGMNPPEIQKVTARYDLNEQSNLEYVFVNNNLTIRNQTQAASSDGAVFDLFMGARKLDGTSSSAPGRAIYFGFTRQLSGGALSMFIDAIDVEGDQTVIFEVLVNSNWRNISADDRTRGFRQRGFIRISIDTLPTLTRLFGQDRFWLRARLTDGASAWQPQLHSIYTNAVNAIQAKTIQQELLGSSNGDPDQQYQLSNQPVIPESLDLRIRENLTQEEHDELIEAFGSDVVAEYREVDLKGSWVLWRRVDSFISYGADDRVYRLDSNSGQINFGSNTRVPPAGRDNIRAISYRSGGGIEGNVTAFSIKALKSTIRGVSKVANPIAAAGGTNTPAVAEQISGSPALIRRASRALMPVDIEALIVASSPDIIRARCLFASSPGEPIRIAVAKRGKSYCPALSLADRKGLSDAVRGEAWGGLEPEGIKIEDPAYIKFGIKVELYAETADYIASLKEAATIRLRRFFNPIDGGPENNGWPFARMLWRSDVLRVLSELEHIDRVLKVDIHRLDCVTLSTPLPETGMICLGEDDLDVVVSVDSNVCREID